MMCRCLQNFVCIFCFSGGVDNKVKLKSFNEPSAYMFCIQVEIYHHEDIDMDENNINTKFKEDEEIELNHLEHYNVLTDLG